MIPQRCALSGIMTLANLNNCAALRRKHGMDLDLVEFKNLARWIEVVTRPDSNNVSGLVFVFVVVVVCFYFIFFFFTRCYGCIVRSTQIISRFDSVSVNHLSLL